MLIEFIKDHLEFKAGDRVDVSEERATYWIAHNVAKPIKKKEKNSNAGPNGGNK